MKYPFEINKNDIEQVDIGWFKYEFKYITNVSFEYRIEEILKKNGWEFVEEDEWGATWKKDFVIKSLSTIYAKIGYKEKHLDGAWKYGLQWLECDYQYKNPYTKSDLKDMYECMRIALEHLLAKGIPFHPQSDIARQQEYWHLTNQEIKRNIDLLNATRLLEFNYNAVKKLCEKEQDKDYDFVKVMSKKDNLEGDEWMWEFLNADKEKEGKGQ